VWVERTGRLAGSAGFQMRIWSGSATPGLWRFEEVARHDYYVCEPPHPPAAPLMEQEVSGLVAVEGDRRGCYVMDGAGSTAPTRLTLAAAVLRAADRRLTWTWWWVNEEVVAFPE
jgi:hypothetical protein